MWAADALVCPFFVVHEDAGWPVGLPRVSVFGTPPELLRVSPIYGLVGSSLKHKIATNSKVIAAHPG